MKWVNYYFCVWRLEMESRYQLNNKDYEFKLSALQLDKDKSDDRLKAYEKQREEIIMENSKLRHMLSNCDDMRIELEREQEKSRELSKRLQRVDAELTSNTSVEHELTEINMKLKNELTLTTHEIRKFKEQINRVIFHFRNVEKKTIVLVLLNLDNFSFFNWKWIYLYNVCDVWQSKWREFIAYY